MPDGLVRWLLAGCIPVCYSAAEVIPSIPEGEQAMKLEADDLIEIREIVMGGGERVAGAARSYDRQRGPGHTRRAGEDAPGGTHFGL